MKYALGVFALVVLAFVLPGNAYSRRSRIECVYQGAPANYQLYIFGGQALRCEGNHLHISRNEQGDGDGPIIIECR